MAISNSHPYYSNPYDSPYGLGHNGYHDKRIIKERAFPEIKARRNHCPTNIINDMMEVVLIKWNLTKEQPISYWIDLLIRETLQIISKEELPSLEPIGEPSVTKDKTNKLLLLL